MRKERAQGSKHSLFHVCVGSSFSQGRGTDPNRTRMMFLSFWKLLASNVLRLRQEEGDSKTNN